MAYAGQEYGGGNAYAGDTAAMSNPIKGGGMSTEHAAAAIVIGALVFLIAINRGFRGVSVGGLSGGLVRP